MKTCYIYIFLLITSICFSQKADSLFLKLKYFDSQSKSFSTDTNKINVLSKLVKTFTNNNPDTAIYFAQQKLALSIQIDLIPEIEAAYSDLGFLFINKGKYADAMQYFLKGQNISKIHLQEVTNSNVLLKLKKIFADSYVGIGTIYAYKGNYSEALNCFYTALSLFEKIRNKPAIASITGNIGAIYIGQNNYSKAIKNYETALSIQKEIGDKKGAAVSYLNIGVINQRQHHYQDALKNYDISLKLYEEIDDKRGIANVYNNRGEVYSIQGKYDEALSNYLSALSFRKKNGDKKGLASIYNNLGKFYYQQHHFSEALKYYNDALLLSKEIGYKYNIGETYLNLSLLDSALGNYKKSLEDYKMYMKYKDSLNNEASLEKTIRIQMDYEFDKKQEAEKAEQKRREIMEAHQKQNQHILLFCFVVGVLIIFLFTLLVYRNKMRSKFLIGIKNEEIARKEANIAGQEEERNRIAKELHDGIGGTLAGIKMKLQYVEAVHENIPELKSVINTIGDTCKEIRTLSHNLAPLILTNAFFIEAMTEVIGKFVIPEKLAIDFEYYPEEELNQIPKNIQAAIYRICQELLNNIIKHANATKVEIALSKEENDIHLLVEDNGIGFENKLKKGMGLKNIESRVHALNGKIVIDSKAGRGTATEIYIPIK